MRLLISLFFATLVTRMYICKLQEADMKWPAVGISVLVRNKFHSLPYFFTCLQRLSYPKDRIYVWVWSDYNQDKSDEVISYWATKNKHQYHGVYVTINSSIGLLHTDEKIATQWTPNRFYHVIKLREQALMFAREKWADFHFMLDADIYLTNPKILTELIIKKKPVVAPLLETDGYYSNFWAAMSDNLFFKSTSDYKKIKERETTGCFEVPMIHSAVLVDMNIIESDLLTYNPEKLSHYKEHIDDTIIFAMSAASNAVPMLICNNIHAGYLQIPLNSGEDPEKDLDQLTNIKMTALKDGHEIPLSADLAKFVSFPEPSRMGFDEIYMINLERRQTRRVYMEKCFKELGMSVKHVKAIDGQMIKLNNLPHNIKLMPVYEDPYHKRPMKTGEIGCFLSHYYIWEEVADEGYDMVMILEDDVYFRPYFRDNLERLMADIKDMEWDLIYIGRKILEKDETHVTQYTVRPLYSYWTIGYLLSASGARKLVDAKPLEKLLPVDEFLPIMFDSHPNNTWKNYFAERTLNVLSATPLLIEPTHYTNDPGYTSDTEDSSVVNIKSTVIAVPKTVHLNRVLDIDYHHSEYDEQFSHESDYDQFRTEL